MDQIQLYRATQSVVATVKSSGMMPALKEYRDSLAGGANVAEAQLIQAADAYIERASAFGDDEAAVVKKLYLEFIGTSYFWSGLTSKVNSVSHVNHDRYLHTTDCYFPPFIYQTC